MKPNKSFYFYE